MILLPATSDMGPNGPLVFITQAKAGGMLDDQDWIAISEGFDVVVNSPGVKRVDGKSSEGHTWKVYVVAGNYRIDIEKDKNE